MNTTSRAARSSHKPNIVGAYLKEKRLAGGRSQLSVAQAAGVAESTISRIESGHILPTVDVLTRIGVALDLDLTELLGQLGARTDCRCQNKAELSTSVGRAEPRSFARCFRQSPRPMRPAAGFCDGQRDCPPSQTNHEMEEERNWADEGTAKGQSTSERTVGG